MFHIAIMRKSWGLIPKILSGEKKIESRWYKNRSAPWGKIKIGDTVYFKNTGELVSVKVKVKEVKQYDNLDFEKVKALLSQYGDQDGINKNDIEKYFNLFKDKRYCILVFLEQPEKIEPFDINKKGFGAMAAWLVIEDINSIKL